ncbi:MAG: hypothetical protein CMI23_04535 [Opitutae bacterium]|nr:hypothetical protein [Opitutae bacterium]
MNNFVKFCSILGGSIYLYLHLSSWPDFKNIFIELPNNKFKVRLIPSQFHLAINLKARLSWLPEMNLKD